MASNIDATKPTAGSATTQSVRDNFQAAKTEIEALQSTSPTQLPVPITEGGTGAATISGARSALGLGTIATQDASAVSITGGDINGVSIGSATAATILKVDNLQLDGNTLSSTNTNGDIIVTPNGTGKITLKGINWPIADGTNGQVIQTNGSGQTSWTNLAGGGDMVSSNNLSDVANAATAFGNIKQAASDTATGVIEIATQGEANTGTDTVRAITPATLKNFTGFLKDIVDDASPQLGADLDVNAHKLVSVSSGNIELLPNGTGKVKISGIFQPTADGSAGDVLQTDGSGQSSYLPYKNIALAGASRNLKVKNNTGSPNSQLDVTADALIVTNSSNFVKYLTSVSVTVNIASSGANGLDTGSEASGTWYYIHIIYNPTTTIVAGLISASATSPTLPSGYTYSALVSCVRNDGSSNFVKIAQLDRIVRTAPQVVFTAQTGVASYTSQSISGMAPPISYRVFGTAGISTTTSGDQAIAVAADANGVGAQYAASFDAAGNIDSFYVAGNFDLTLLTAQTLYWISSNTSSIYRLAISGYVI